MELWNFIKRNPTFLDCTIITAHGDKVLTNKCFLAHGLGKYINTLFEHQTDLEIIYMPNHTVSDLIIELKGFILVSSSRPNVEESSSSSRPLIPITKPPRIESRTLGAIERSIELEPIIAADIICDLKRTPYNKRREEEKSSNTTSSGTVNRSKTFLCPHCGRFFKDGAKLKVHKYMVHSNNFVKCDICSLYLKTKSSLHNHMLTHKEPSFSCSKCSKTFRTKQNCQRHINTCNI